MPLATSVALAGLAWASVVHQEAASLPIDHYTPASRQDRVEVALDAPLGPAAVIRFELVADGPGRILTLPGFGSLQVDRAGTLWLAEIVEEGRWRSRSFATAGPGTPTRVALFIEGGDFERIACVTDRGEWAQIRDVGAPEIDRCVLGSADGDPAWSGGLRDLKVVRGLTSTERLLAELAPAALVPSARADDEGTDKSASIHWASAQRSHFAIDGDALVWAPAQWRREDLPMGPRARTAHPCVMLPDGRVVIFSGEVRDTHLPPVQTVADTWIYDPSVPTWIEVGSPESPHGRSHVPLAFEPETGGIVLIHGWDNGWGRDFHPNDAWVLTLDGGGPPLETEQSGRTTGAWTPLPADFHEPFLQGDFAVLFHPALGGLTGFRNQGAFRFDRGSFGWRTTHGMSRATGGYLSGAASRGYVLDEATGDVWFVGGSIVFDVAKDANRKVDETVRWDFETGDYETLETDPTPPPRARPLIGFDPGLRRILLFGGSVKQDERRGDFWTFDVDQRRWREHRMADSPGPRGGFMAPMFDRQRGELVMVHGRSAGERFHEDVWRLRFDPEAEGRVEVVLDRAESPRASAVRVATAGGAQASCRARILEQSSERVRVEVVAWSVDEDDPLRIESIELSQAVGPEEGTIVLVLEGD